MNRELFIRTEMLIGGRGMERLHKARVAVFGIGGVGGFAVEALVRGGVGALALFDSDCVSVSNRNRQLIATERTVGRPKVEVMKERILDINPEADVEGYQVFYLPENAGHYDLGRYDYIIDAVDTVTAKLELAVRAQQAGVPIISSMGTGNKCDPTMLEVGDLYQTSVCPLAKVMRRECKKRGILKLKVVYSKEEVLEPQFFADSDGKAVPGSLSFVPSVAGLILAGEVIKDLVGWKGGSRGDARVH